MGGKGKVEELFETGETGSEILPVLFAGFDEGGKFFELLPADGTYFQCVRYEAISKASEAEFAEWLTGEIKVAAIPVSAFYQAGKESSIVRFCFAKKDETLRLALDRLARI